MAIVSVEKAVWENKYAVGIEIIDNQHKGLFDTYNRLVETVLVAQEFGTDANEILIELVDYIENHFSAEEDIWRKNAEIYAKQQKEHFSFVKKIMAASKKDLQNEDIAVDMLDYLREWLTEHFMMMDLEDFKEFKAKGLI